MLHPSLDWRARRRVFQRHTAACIALLCAFVTAAVPVRAIDGDALLDTLVRKHVLTETEAAALRDEDAQKQKEVRSNKLKLSDSITELRLYGDIRERYQYSELQNQIYPPTYKYIQDGLGLGFYFPVLNRKTSIPHGDQQSQWQFRLQLGAEVKLGEQWFGGFELSTNPSSDNSYQTYNSEFGKFGIYISKAYIGYRPSSWLTLEVGKTSNPFYTTDLVWDQDINPSGLYEMIAFHNLGAPRAEAGLPKDGTGKPESSRPWELTLVAGQLAYQDHNEGADKYTYPYYYYGTSPPTFNTPHDETTDAFVFETQLIGSYQTHGIKFTLAPGWLVENASDVTGRYNSVGFTSDRNLSVLLAPGDVSFNIGGLKAKIYWDFAYNTEGAGRYNDVYFLDLPVDANGRKLNQHSAQDDIAWLAGFRLGENKKRGDLSFTANFRRTGISSVDPNLNDSNFALGFLNTQGYTISLAYNLTNFTIFQVSWYDAWNFRKNLIGGSAADEFGSGVANANQAKLLQVDLNLSF